MAESLNLNVVTAADVAVSTPAPGAGDTPAPAAVAAAPGTPTVDDYWAKLRKYVPAETIGGYLVLDGLLRQAWDKPTEITQLRVALFVAAVALAGLTWVATRTLLNIKRPAQRAVSVVAFAVWIVGEGTFLTTFPLWEPVFGVIAIVVFGVFVAVYKVKPLVTAA